MLSLHEKNNIYMFFCTEYGLTKFTRGYTEHSFKCLQTGSDHAHCYTGKLSCYLSPVCGHSRWCLVSGRRYSCYVRT